MGVKLAIFEDNPKFIEAIGIMVEAMNEVELVGVYTDTSDIVNQLSDSRPDIVLMDIKIKPLNGIESTKLILEHFPQIRILMQTVFEDDNHVFAAICAGASGYILKRHLQDALPAYLKEIQNGGAPMSPNIAQHILALFRKHFFHTTLAESYNLSKREKEILKLLVEGLSYKMIADRCSISIETVKTHFKRIYEKLHVASMTEAVAKAIYENLT